MKFETITKLTVQKHPKYISDPEKFSAFTKDFDIVGVSWGKPNGISASYFLRLLEEGSSARARGRGFADYYLENDEGSNQLHEFYLQLFDHGALWKQKNGHVICTAMPYGNKKIVCNSFKDLVNTYNYPSEIQMKLLDNIYKFRNNGDLMIIIYANDDSIHE